MKNITDQMLTELRRIDSLLQECKDKDPQGLSAQFTPNREVMANALRDLNRITAWLKMIN